MALTVSMDEFKRVNYQRCLRQSDIRPITELAQKMNSTDDERELLHIAREMLNQNRRNNRACHNEHNVELFKDLLVDRTHRGDVLTTHSACELLYERGIDCCGAKYYALLAALDDLVTEGYFTRDIVTKVAPFFDRGRGHYTIYIVN